MQIFSTISDLTKTYPNIVVALGTFDGVHIGHQNIIKQAIDLAKSINGTSVVFSFSNHPLGIIAPARCPLRIADNEYKAQMLEELGVDVLINIAFTPDFLKLSPNEFLELLKENLDPKYIVVGPNYSFGYGGKGNPEFLVRKGNEFGFISEIRPAVCVGNKIASSTRIRRLIALGEIEEANYLLGKRFKITGTVGHGDQRGRSLGFPTANFEIELGRAIPNNGVYAVYAYVHNRQFTAIANIGTNPTFNGEKRHIEIHIFDFDQDIYNEKITIEFIKKIRNQQVFPSAEALVAQIKLDVKAAIAIFKAL